VRRPPPPQRCVTSSDAELAIATLQDSVPKFARDLDATVAFLDRACHADTLMSAYATDFATALLVPATAAAVRFTSGALPRVTFPPLLGKASAARAATATLRTAGGMVAYASRTDVGQSADGKHTTSSLEAPYSLSSVRPSAEAAADVLLVLRARHVELKRRRVEEGAVVTGAPWVKAVQGGGLAPRGRKGQRAAMLGWLKNMCTRVCHSSDRRPSQ
jgi:hypothetical protein